MKIILIALLLIGNTFLYAEANQHSQNTYTKCLLKPYALTNNNISKYKNISYDENGIPLLNFYGRKIYYPILYLQVALTYYDHYYTFGDEKSKEKFLRISQFVLDSFEQTENWGGTSYMIILKNGIINYHIDGFPQCLKDSLSAP